MDDINEDTLCYLSVAEQRRLYRNRQISPVDVLWAQIKRAERIEPTINAFCETYYDEAMDAAKRSETRYSGRSPNPRPLEGITVSIKDVLDHAGKINSMGSLMYRDNVASKSHPVVQRILDAGGVIHARTTTSEFAFGWITASRLWGTTRNPWNPQFTPGGSSGGAAASLASGTSTLAIGADSAGSIRVPASMCGVVGYKPPHGRVPDPMFGYDTYSVIGPLGRTVPDCVALQNVISGIHPDDITTIRNRVDVPESCADVENASTLRIALAMSVGNATISKDCEDVVRSAMRVASENGATVDEITVDWSPEVIEAGKLHGAHMFQSFFDDALKNHEDQLCDYTLHTANQIDRCDARKFVWTHQVAQQMYASLAHVLETYDALVCPTTITNEIGANQMPWENSIINGVSIDSDYDWVATVPFNMLGQLPVVALPAGVARNGLPVGLQVVGRSFDDVRAFRAAQILERLLSRSGVSPVPDRLVVASSTAE